LSEQPTLAALVHSVAELAERLAPHTATEGRELARKQAEDLQTSLESHVDALTRADRELQVCLNRWSGFEEASSHLLKWLSDMEKSLPGITSAMVLI